MLWIAGFVGFVVGAAVASACWLWATAPDTKKDEKRYLRFQRGPYRNL